MGEWDFVAVNKRLVSSYRGLVYQGGVCLVKVLMVTVTSV